jgi:hypothetical protein
MSYMMSKQQYLGDEVRHWQRHLMFHFPEGIEATSWGANLPDSPVLARSAQLPDGSREPINIFLFRLDARSPSE